MWLHLVCVLELLIAVDALVTCSPHLCKSSLATVRPVCGSDGFSYPNRCVFKLAHCFNTNITQTHKGPCRKQRTCSDYVRTFPFHAFKPQCRSDGNYSPSQCDNAIGYCWCVTSQGAPISKTLIRRSPNDSSLCERKKTARRRSPSQSKKPARACKREDRAKFNNNLIEIFQSEWSREMGAVTTSSDEAYGIVLDWKFKQMDQDRNNQLDKTEYRDLRRIVKKAVKPKRCAKNFAKACDMNRDQLIGRQEWSECLTRDGADGSTDSSNSDSEEEEEPGEVVQMSSTQRPPHGVLLSGGKILNDEDSSERRDEDAIDCRTDRQSALNEMVGNSSSNLYVPECTPDGRYQKIQCYKGAGYCWCVHEDTGKNIPGTSVKDKIPKCDQNLSFTRSMKGCSEEKKNVFLKNLMKLLNDRMAKDINGTNIASANGPSWKASREEQVATWSFVVYDKNKNKVLDKNEWKLFKDSVGAAKNLRKCSKKLPRYCDINKDRQISMTEWLECLNTNRIPEKAAASPLGSKRTGVNPLKTILID